MIKSNSLHIPFELFFLLLFFSPSFAHLKGQDTCLPPCVCSCPSPGSPGSSSSSPPSPSKSSPPSPSSSSPPSPSNKSPPSPSKSSPPTPSISSPPTPSKSSPPTPSTPSLPTPSTPSPPSSPTPSTPSSPSPPKPSSPSPPIPSSPSPSVPSSPSPPKPSSPSPPIPSSPSPSVPSSPSPPKPSSPSPPIPSSPSPPIPSSPSPSVPSTPSPSVPSSSSSSSSSLQFSYKGSFSKIYAFGGSYTDTGNAKALGALSSFFFGAHSPYGSTTFGKPSNRLCNGRLLIDFLCQSLGLPSLEPYKSASTVSANFSFGVNFAVAGSTALSSDFFAKHKTGQNLVWSNMYMSMQTQIDWFNTFQQQEICKGKDANSCKAELENALFWIGEMGVNDYATSYRSSISLQMLTESCIVHITKLLKTLLDCGAKYIVVQGLPPVGCLACDVSLCPLINLDKMGCVTVVNSAIMIHNQILQRKIAAFQKQYPDCTIVYADYWNAYLTILKNPQKYQFEETFKACCGLQDGKLNYNSNSFCGSPGTSTCKDPSKYINWDGIHLTEAMHKHVAELILNQGFCQPSFDELIKKRNGV